MSVYGGIGISLILEFENNKIMLHRLKNYEKFGNQQRKRRKNLQVTEKMPIFASSNNKFGYPGRIPRGVRPYRYCPFLKSHSLQWLFIFVCTSS